jgi:N6-L-threonylcarbamoyladenine synthase
LAKEGNSQAFKFNKPNIAGYDYSFSGLKTSFLYLLRDEIKKNPNFVAENKADLCASLQDAIVDVLMKILLKASIELKISEVTLAGGVSANSGLRQAFLDYGAKYNWQVYIPPFALTTDNAAMVAVTGYFKYLNKDFSSFADVPYARNAPITRPEGRAVKF